MLAGPSVARVTLPELFLLQVVTNTFRTTNIPDPEPGPELLTLSLDRTAAPRAGCGQVRLGSMAVASPSCLEPEHLEGGLDPVPGSCPRWVWTQGDDLVQVKST